MALRVKAEEMGYTVTTNKSLQVHKEFRDKEAIRTLLVSLSGDSVGKPILYGEEVYFNMA